MSATKLLVSVIGAAAAGVLIGTYLTSEKGSQLLENVKRSAEDLINNKLQGLHGQHSEEPAHNESQR